MSEAAVADTRRLNAKPQDLTDAYGPPSNFLEIDIFNPQTVGMGRARYTSYELRMRVRARGGRGGTGLGARNGPRSPVCAGAGLGRPVARRTARGGPAGARCRDGQGRAAEAGEGWGGFCCSVRARRCVRRNPGQGGRVQPGRSSWGLAVARQGLCLSAVMVA